MEKTRVKREIFSRFAHSFLRMRENPQTLWYLEKKKRENRLKNLLTFSEVFVRISKVSGTAVQN